MVWLDSATIFGFLWNQEFPCQVEHGGSGSSGSSPYWAPPPLSQKTFYPPLPIPSLLQQVAVQVTDELSNASWHLCDTRHQSLLRTSWELGSESLHPKYCCRFPVFWGSWKTILLKYTWGSGALHSPDKSTWSLCCYVLEVWRQFYLPKGSRIKYIFSPLPIYLMCHLFCFHLNIDLIFFLLLSF